MSAEISDDAAIEFAVAFYDALGAGRPIEAAYAFGCNAINMKGIPEHLTPILKTKVSSPDEKQRLAINRNPSNDVIADISVINDDSDTWHRGDDTIVQYAVAREDGRVKICYQLGYMEQMKAGGPIGPMSYLSPTMCPFRWDFPALDFKMLNRGQRTIFLTEIILDVDESRSDCRPLLVIKRDVQQRFAGDLLLVNEGWCDLVDIRISFNLLPGEHSDAVVPAPPYRNSIHIPLLSDHAEVDVMEAFEREGVNVAGLILLTNGKWEDNETFVIPTVDGFEERISLAELEIRTKQFLSVFTDYVGTLVGEINFTAANNPDVRSIVKFRGIVYLANANRVGLPRPPTAAYGTVFETTGASYQRRVQISHELQPGETDRFTVKVAVRQSSFHSVRATIRDITGRELKLPPIHMGCFVPRSRKSFLESRLKIPDGS